MRKRKCTLLQSYFLKILLNGRGFFVTLNNLFIEASEDHTIVIEILVNKSIKLKEGVLPISYNHLLHFSWSVNSPYVGFSAISPMISFCFKILTTKTCLRICLSNLGVHQDSIWSVKWDCMARREAWLRNIRSCSSYSNEWWLQMNVINISVTKQLVIHGQHL